MQNLIRIIVAGLLGSVAIGCNRETPVPLHPVSGRVVFDGRPLHKGDIIFVPDATKGNTFLQFGMGKIAPDGSYTAKTFSEGGVKPGWYKVKIFATENEPQASLSWVPIWIIPEKYADHDTSELSVEVVPDPAPDRYDFTLQR